MVFFFDVFFEVLGGLGFGLVGISGVWGFGVGLGDLVEAWGWLVGWLRWGLGWDCLSLRGLVCLGF